MTRTMAVILESNKNPPLAAEVMVVDDQPTSRVILETILRSIGDNINVTGFDSSLVALQYLEAGCVPDLIVADYRMPGMDGIAFTRGIRQTAACQDVPLVIVTVVEQKSVMYEALEAGATDFLTKPVDHYECKVRCRNLLTMRRQQLIIRNRASALETRIHQSVAQAHARERDTLGRLAQVVKYLERRTGNPEHVGHLARSIAAMLGQPASFCDAIELAAPLHDIGKIGIADALLEKSAAFTAEEVRQMQAHTHIGHNLLRDSLSPVLQMAATIALQHHEAWDGTGYPQGLQGDAITLEARIVAVVDTWDTLRGGLPYRVALAPADALAEMRRLRGNQLDPACVDALLACGDRVFPDGPQSRACTP